MNKKFTIPLLAIVLSVSACTTTLDSKVLSTQFEYPNCDFKEIGPIEARLPSHLHFITSPAMGETDFNQLVSEAKNKAAEKYPNGGPVFGLVDLIISSDVTIYGFGLFQTQYRISATAITAVQCGQQKGTWRPL